MKIRKWNDILVLLLFCLGIIFGVMWTLALLGIGTLPMRYIDAVPLFLIALVIIIPSTFFPRYSLKFRIFAALLFIIGALLKLFSH